MFLPDSLCLDSDLLSCALDANNGTSVHLFLLDFTDYVCHETEKQNALFIAHLE